MHTTRPAAVAGQFYPAEPAVLQQTLDQLLAQPVEPLERPPRAIIVPHAGYPFSGQIAGRAYASLAPFHDHYDRVLLLGPAHRSYIPGMAVPRAGFFATPLGDVTIDSTEVAALAEHKTVHFNDEAHAHEHSLEVQLPFLQQVLDDFHLIPVAVGDTDADSVKPVISRYWDKTRTLIVISTDLSHYLDYDSACKLDALTGEAIAHLEPERIGNSQACGRIALRALLSLARQHHAHVTTLAMANSGDSAGPRDRVVGYGAWLVSA